jgi:hypothetical protein
LTRQFESEVATIGTATRYWRYQSSARNRYTRDVADSQVVERLSDTGEDEVSARMDIALRQRRGPTVQRPGLTDARGAGSGGCNDAGEYVRILVIT